MFVLFSESKMPACNIVIEGFFLFCLSSSHAAAITGATRGHLPPYVYAHADMKCCFGIAKSTTYLSPDTAHIDMFYLKCFAISGFLLLPPMVVFVFL